MKYKFILFSPWLLKSPARITYTILGVPYYKYSITLPKILT